MKGFFWRLFLGYWAVIVLSGFLTIVVVSATTTSLNTREEYRDKLLEKAAEEFERVNLSSDSSDTLAVFNRLPEFEGFFDVYIFDKDNVEIRNRELPLLVRFLVFRVNRLQSSSTFSSFDPRLNFRYVNSADGGRYLLVGRLNIFILGELLLRPGARFVLLLSGILFSAMLSFLLARFIIMPVSKLQHAGREIARGDLGVRISGGFQNRKDDLAELARDFDFMADKIDLLLKNKEQLLTDVSHELRSPLARLQASVSLARQKSISTANLELDRIEHESEVLSDLIGHILTYSRLALSSEVSFEATDIVDLVRTISEDAQYEGSAENKLVEFRTGVTSLVLMLNNSLISSAVENIVRNALKYTPMGKKVSIELRVGKFNHQEGDAVYVTVEDQGVGVPDDELECIFDPFYRVDPSRNVSSGGGGIGLAIAYRAAKIHQGGVYAVNRKEGGLQVCFSMPCIPARKP